MNGMVASIFFNRIAMKPSVTPCIRVKIQLDANDYHAKVNCKGGANGKDHVRWQQ